MSFSFGDRENFIDKNIFLLTGVTRSGTTFFGKVLGSMINVEYHFEPPFMIWIPAMSQTGILEEKTAKEFLKANVYEVYYDRILGRADNFRPGDDSYILGYSKMSDLKNKWKTLQNRADAKEHAVKNNLKLALKMPNAQLFYGFYREVFPEIKFIHMVRHPYDVALSVQRKGWLSDLSFSRSSASFARKKIFYKGQELNVPFWLEEDSVDVFMASDEFSRGLIYWRIIMSAHLSSKEFSSIKEMSLEFRYEDLIAQPEKIVDEACHFMGARPSEKTKELLAKVRKDRISTYQPQGKLQIPGTELERIREIMNQYEFYIRT